jgi:hypothetical protein
VFIVWLLVVHYTYIVAKWQFLVNHPKITWSVGTYYCGAMGIIGQPADSAG